MIIYILLIATLLFALLSIAAAGRYRGRNVPHLLVAISIAAFIHLYGAWVLLSVYLKYVFDIIFVAALCYSVIQSRGGVRNSKWTTLVNLLFISIFATLSLLYFTGTTGNQFGLAQLQLPFRSGSYFVFQGGKGLPTNLFHYKLRGAVLAMDLVKLNAAGNRAKHIFSQKLADYEIYNDTLYSPCDGRVARINDGNPDNTPPNRMRGPTNTNFVLLETKSMYVFMAHLKPGSILVADDAEVKAGQPLALCGNSGFSIEPHLHIQAHVKTNPAIPWYREKPLLIQFNGRFYNLFETIKAGDK